MTPDKKYKPATENDYNIHDLSSGDETDQEDAPRKKVPAWAEGTQLKRALEKINRDIYSGLFDPNKYFGEIEAVSDFFSETVFSDGCRLETSNVENRSPSRHSSHDSYEMTPDKKYNPATENDYNIHDLSSGDETDQEDAPRKKVPAWAEGTQLKRALEKINKDIYSGLFDPNKYFGEIEAVSDFFSKSVFSDGCRLEVSFFVNTKNDT
ncbi:unnamed protein product [Strongylus vulgaris]|uniref:Inner centromere protein ARK-binding domain-containing protein n=1 Tax=Strongylus vulgaris TaxID=40348 RepID=A0A3P7LCV6_STRVU|nr:unnamed protein product [Strongylus vulgaris]